MHQHVGYEQSNPLLLAYTCQCVQSVLVFPLSLMPALNDACGNWPDFKQEHIGVLSTTVIYSHSYMLAF